MIPETGTLTLALNDFLTVFKLGQDAVRRDATSILSIVAAIELVLLGLAWATTGSDALNALFRKILTISFFVFIIDNYDSLLRTVIAGFLHTGKTAGTGSSDVLSSFRDPSSIIDVGFRLTTPIFEHLKNASLLSFPISDALISLFSALCILAAFFIIAIQVFITYLEFAMISTLGLIFIPFGIFRHTSFLTEKTFGAVISFGVKLMVLGLLVSVSMPLLRGLELPTDPNWTQLFQMVVVCLAVAALSWHAPGLAAGLLAGGPVLSAQNVLQAGAAGVVAGAAAPVVLGKGIGSVTKTASYGLGKISGNAQVQAASSSIKGAEVTASLKSPSKVAQARGIVANYGKATLASAAQAAKNRVVSAVTENLTRGRESVPGYRALVVEREAGLGADKSKITGEASEVQSTNVRPYSKSSPSPLRTYGAYKAIVPAEAHPKGGIHVPIRENEEK